MSHAACCRIQLTMAWVQGKGFANLRRDSRASLSVRARLITVLTHVSALPFD